MKKRILRVCLLAALLLALGPFGTTAYAEDISATLLCEEEAEAGSSFSAALEYRGDSLGSASIEVNYDPQILEFRSCSGGEGFAAEDGLVRIQLSAEGDRAYLSCKIRFHALAEGESFITVTASSLTNEAGEKLVAETRSVKVTVVPDAVEASGGDAVQEPETPDASVESSSDREVPDGGLLGLYAWVKEGIESGSFAAEAEESLRGFMEGLSVMEFLVLSLCVCLILLLLVLLAAEKRKGKR